MKRQILAISVLLIVSTIPVQAGEIAGTRVKGDVQLDCYRQGLELDAQNQWWSFCIDPILPTTEYTTLQPMGFKPTPDEPPFEYRVWGSDTPSPVVQPETTTVVTDTATAKIETATALSDIDFSSPDWFAEFIAWFNNIMNQFYAIIEGLKK